MNSFLSKLRKERQASESLSLVFKSCSDYFYPRASYLICKSLTFRRERGREEKMAEEGGRESDKNDRTEIRKGQREQGEEEKEPSIGSGTAEEAGTRTWLEVPSH